MFCKVLGVQVIQQEVVRREDKILDATEEVDRVESDVPHIRSKRNKNCRRCKMVERAQAERGFFASHPQDFEQCLNSKWCCKCEEGDPEKRPVDVLFGEDCQTPTE